MQTFEDAFVEAQASAVSLCMEFLEDTQTEIDTVYIYIYSTEHSFFFNAFFEGNGKVYRTGDLFDKEYVKEFLDCGAEDAVHIRDVCRSYHKNCPCEMKMIFHTHTHSFDADYRYDPLDENKGEFPAFRFMEWCREIQNG